MKIEVFSIYDNKAKAFSQPFYSPTVAVGIRNFEAAVKDANTQLHKHPEDFTLFHVASYDDEVGRFNNLEHIANLGLAAQFL